MNLAYQDDWLTIWGGDCRTVLAELPDESVHCVVTSPPYWGLRDYGTATWEGGEDGCDHLGPPRASEKTGLSHRSERPPGQVLTQPSRLVETPYAKVCGKCGAVRIDSQLGLEPTPEQYVENMVAVFREVRRVLRSDGTVWLNLGDSYGSGNSGQRVRNTNGGFGGTDGGRTQAATMANPGTLPVPGMSKQLMGIPWRVAFALQADGWYLRSDIIWSKPNPMPESVTDRPTKSHEYVFLLAKSPRYYFDADAVREPDGPGVRYPMKKQGEGIVLGRATDPHGGLTTKREPGAGRNIRSVWTVATQPYPGAHFAVFPEKLIEPCILAGTSERGVCPECGRPWRRVTETTPLRGERDDSTRDADKRDARRGMAAIPEKGWETTTRTLSWIPSCAHDAEPVGAVVLDPFGGSGTTARVANRLSRRAVLIDLNPDYLKQQMDRNRDLPLGLGA